MIDMTCSDCRRRGFGPMLLDDLWITIAKKEEFLCFGCIEIRLDRPIFSWDLSDAAMNDSVKLLLEEREERTPYSHRDFGEISREEKYD